MNAWRMLIIAAFACTGLFQTARAETIKVKADYGHKQVTGSVKIDPTRDNQLVAPWSHGGIWRVNLSNGTPTFTLVRPCPHHHPTPKSVSSNNILPITVVEVSLPTPDTTPTLTKSSPRSVKQVSFWEASHNGRISIAILSLPIVVILLATVLTLLFIRIQDARFIKYAVGLPIKKYKIEQCSHAHFWTPQILRNRLPRSATIGSQPDSGQLHSLGASP